MVSFCNIDHIPLVPKIQSTVTMNTSILYYVGTMIWRNVNIKWHVSKNWFLHSLTMKCGIIIFCRVLKSLFLGFFWSTTSWQVRLKGHRYFIKYSAFIEGFGWIHIDFKFPDVFFFDSLFSATFLNNWWHLKPFLSIMSRW